jgi:hypothetical protein
MASTIRISEIVQAKTCADWLFQIVGLVWY